MTTRQRLELRSAEIRERLSEIGALQGDEYTEEIRAEETRLQTEFRELQPRIRSAIISESADPDHADDVAADVSGESNELRTMLAEFNPGNVFAAAFEKRATDGREAELQQHFGIGAHAIPLEALALESRAVTPAPANTGASQAEIVQPVFARGDADYLGTWMPTVAVGEATYPVLTSRPTVGGPHSDSTSVAETTGAFTGDALEPERLQASFYYRRTDAARFAGMGEALRLALRDGLGEAVDAQVVAQIVADVARTDAAAVFTYGDYLQDLVYSRIDGRYASRPSDIRLLLGSETMAAASDIYRSANAGEMSAAEKLESLAGGARVSAHVPAAAASKQDVIVRRGSRRDLVAPMWQGVSLIPDEITRADTGEIKITAVLLAAFKVIRAAGFDRIQTQHA